MTSTYLNGHEGDIVFNISPPYSYFDLLKPSKQERFITAWKDGPDFALTGDNAFASQRDADIHANELARINVGSTVVVLKVVSQHSSRVVVTTAAA